MAVVIRGILRKVKKYKFIPVLSHSEQTGMNFILHPADSYAKIHSLQQYLSESLKSSKTNE